MDQSKLQIWNATDQNNLQTKTAHQHLSNLQIFKQIAFPERNGSKKLTN
jgi:hypothetical protein